MDLGKAQSGQFLGLPCGRVKRGRGGEKRGGETGERLAQPPPSQANNGGT